MSQASDILKMREVARVHYENISRQLTGAISTEEVKKGTEVGRFLTFLFENGLALFLTPTSSTMAGGLDEHGIPLIKEFHFLITNKFVMGEYGAMLHPLDVGEKPIPFSLITTDIRKGILGLVSIFSGKDTALFVNKNPLDGKVEKFKDTIQFPEFSI